MSLPHPSVIRRRIQELEFLARSIPVAYRTAHNMAFAKVRSEEVAVKSSGHSNPTKDNATDSKAMGRRYQIEEGVREIDSALAQVRSALGRFNGSLQDQRSIQNAPELDSATGDRFVKERKAIQRRHIQNDEWDGDSSEVV